MKWLLATLRVLLGGMFIYAGAVKVGSPQPFADSIASFRLLPASLIDLVALGLPSFEVLLGLWLLTGWRRRQAAFCTLAVTGVFLLALGSAFVRGLSVDCGCFGSGGDPLVGSGHAGVALVRDGLLAAVAAALYVSAVRCQDGAARLHVEPSGSR